MPERIWCQEKTDTASFPTPCLILYIPVLYAGLNPCGSDLFSLSPLRYSILGFPEVIEQ
jgi:hypothetical protein